MAKKLEDMTYEEWVETVRAEMLAGGSNASVANKYEVTPGAVAGIRWRHDIPSTNKPPNMGRAKPKPAPLPKPKPRTAPAKPAPPLPPPRQKPKIEGLEEAKSEATRCEYPREHCPYEADVGSPFCKLHK